MATFTALVFLLIATESVKSVLEEEKQATMLSAKVGEYVAFDCPLDFPHDYVIPYILRWNKEGTLVFTSYEGGFDATGSYKGRISLVPPDSPYGKGSINLTNIRESDGGWYECSVFFPNRTPSTRPNGTWFHLSVEGGTLLTIPPINQTTLAGNPAHFTCVSKDKDAVSTWYKDGVPLSSIADLQNRFYTINGSLTIDPTDVSDPGEYSCVVRNVQGEEQTASAYLNVQYKAKVVKALSEVYLPYGKPGILDCHFLSNPPLTNIRWEKDGFLFDPYNVPGVFYGKNGSLYFTKVNESHSGVYTCTPKNELGTEGPSPPINVIVQRPPTFTIVPHNLYLRKPGDTLEMPCDAVDGNNNHKPTIVWFRKDGSPLPMDRITIHNGNLTIENLKDSDRGLYQCVASNEAATISSDTELMIDNVAPRAPYNLSATSTENSVTLTWVPGFTRPKAEYSVWYRAVDTPEWRTSKILHVGANNKTVSNLSPGRTYEFMVLSQDRHGDGMFSKAVRVTTRGSGRNDVRSQFVPRSLEFMTTPEPEETPETVTGLMDTEFETEADILSREEYPDILQEELPHVTEPDILQEELPHVTEPDMLLNEIEPQIPMLESAPVMTEKPAPAHKSPVAKKRKNKRFLTETEETRGLRTAELHRLVLLEQLKLARLQLQRDELQLKLMQLQLQREELLLKKLENSAEDTTDSMF